MRNFLIVFCLSVSGINIFSQVQPVPSNPHASKESRGEDLEKERRKNINLTHREIDYPREKPLTREERNKIRLLTIVNEDDKARYKSFLKQSNTGIFRLLPDFECETKNIIKINGNCENFVPGSWAYSFRTKDYAEESFEDLSFKKDSFVTDGFLSQGILVSLGDKSLDEITLNSSGMNYLVNLKPENDRKILERQYQEISEGIEQNGFLYTNKSKVKVNNTYALRIIAYKYKDKWFSRFRGKNDDKVKSEDIKFFKLNYNKRSDSIVVFRIIRKSKDGGITILWKQLSKQKSPKIFYRKDEKFEDFKSGK